MANQDSPSLRGLTIYLIKEDYRTVEAIIAQEEISAYKLSSGRHRIGDLFVQPSRPKPPRWAEFFKDYVDAREFGRVASAAAVLVIPARSRLFAVTFGHGRYLINPNCWEERFGLRVALNSLDEQKVRSIDKRSFDSISRHSREQASREATAQDFGLDVEQDLLRAVTGTPTNTELGRRLYGMDALHATVRICIEDLQELLGIYYEQYLDDSYKKSFPWVDQIAEISSKAVIAELDNILIRRIADNDLEGIWMAVPEVVPWERIDGFRFGLGQRYPLIHDIHLPHFREAVRDIENLTKRMLTHKKVFCMDVDGRKYDTWQAYRCLYAEIEEEGDTYLLNGGKWYRLTRDFVREINAYFESMDIYDGQLLPYEDDSETAYNLRVADSEPARFALMDRRTIPYGGGYNRIEFCDLFSRGREIIHVKRYGASSVLSHLFAQGLVSGELFHTEPEFRQAVNGLLPTAHKFEDANRMPRPGEYEIVFAVVSDAPGDLVVPFFSRVNLKHAARRLCGYGYQVSRAKIEVTEQYRALRRYG